MYRMISIIVHAKDEVEALKKANQALDNLIKPNKLFDFYKTLDDEEYWKESEDVKKEFPIAILASNPRGVNLIEECWRKTVKEFMFAFEKVKLAIQHLTPEQIMENNVPEDLPEDLKENLGAPLIRYYFQIVGDESETAMNCWLYYKDMPVTARRYLDEFLKPKMGMEAYVVPARVHF